MGLNLPIQPVLNMNLSRYREREAETERERENKQRWRKTRDGKEIGESHRERRERKIKQERQL